MENTSKLSLFGLNTMVSEMVMGGLRITSTETTFTLACDEIGLSKPNFFVGKRFEVEKNK